MTIEHREPQPAAADDGIRYPGVLRSPSREDTFRRLHLNEDIATAGACLLVVVIGGVLYSLIDYRLFSFDVQFYILLEVRLLTYLIAILSWQRLRRCNTPAAFDRLVLLLCFFGAATSLYVNITRPPGQIGHVIVTVMVLALTYCVVPLPLLLQMLWAVPFSMAYVACMPEHGRNNGEPTTTTSVALAFAAANVLGILTSWRLNQRRRLAFVAALRETELRVRLEQALAETRTLRGYLSICAWCKRVWDEDHGWQNVEAPVQDRTHAPFTHSLCPVCFEKHFGAVMQAEETRSSIVKTNQNAC